MEYKSVPNILTQKDILYLEDMFKWNFNAYKMTNDIYEAMEDETIKKHLLKSLNIFDCNMQKILKVLKEGKA